MGNEILELSLYSLKFYTECNMLKFASKMFCTSSDFSVVFEVSTNSPNNIENSR